MRSQPTVDSHIDIVDELLARYFDVVNQRRPHLVHLNADKWSGKTTILRGFGGALYWSNPRPTTIYLEFTPNGVDEWRNEPFAKVIRAASRLSSSSRSIRRSLHPAEPFGAAIGAVGAASSITSFALRWYQTRQANTAETGLDTITRAATAATSQRPTVVILDGLHLPIATAYDYILHDLISAARVQPLLLVVASSGVGSGMRMQTPRLASLMDASSSNLPAVMLEIPRLTRTDIEQITGPAQGDVVDTLADISLGNVGLLLSTWSQWRRLKAIHRTPTRVWAFRNREIIRNELLHQLSRAAQVISESFNAQDLLNRLPHYG